MTRKQQLQQELFNLKAQAKGLLNKDGVTKEELEAVQNSIQTVQAKIDLLDETEVEEKVVDQDPKNRTGKPLPKGMDEKEPNARYEDAFYNALRGKATQTDIEVLDARNSLSSGTPADGGLLIPIDQQTQINELKRQYSPLRELVTVEPVSTLSGNRVLEKDAEHTAFAQFTEGNGLAEAPSPQFAKIDYTIKNYGGILPVPKTLLADQQANLKGYLNKWLAKKAVATENGLIISLLNALPKVDLENIDDIKDILDVTLDPAISSLAAIVTNQDGFNYFNKLKDSQGNYLLEKDPKNPTKRLLAGKEVIVLSNKVLKTTGTAPEKAPVIIGSLKEAVVLFDRETISLLSTDVGGDAFKNNRVDIRAIMRLDVKGFDTSAVVYGEVALPEPAPEA